MPDTSAVNIVPDTISGLRLGIFGHPVAQSLSPKIHAAFAAQLGVAVDYIAIDVAPGELAAALAAFARAGGHGGNVTVPHKLDALALCSTLGERATRAGAVNTLLARDGGWHGDNTDGAGLVRDLADRHGLDLRERRTLLLGAGGAARGVAPALLDAGIGELFIVNRDSARGDALSDLLGEPGRVHSRYVEDLRELGEFELVINATSAGRGSAAMVLPMSLAGARTAAVDLNYGEAAIPFLAWAQAAGVRDAIDGLGMLVEQAADAFELWHGTRPSTDAVFAELRSHDAILASAE